MTVNLGLRYEYETPMAEADNKSVRGFDVAAVQAIEAAARAKYAQNPTPEVPVSEFEVRGGLTFAGVNGEPSGLYDTPKSNFMPRLRWTYRVNDVTVLRAGYGMYYGFLGQRRGDVFQSGFKLSSPRESHPQALPEPYVSLSTHTAPMVETALRRRSHRTSNAGSRLMTRSSQAHARVR